MLVADKSPKASHLKILKLQQQVLDFVELSLDDESEKAKKLEALNKSKYSLLKNEDSLNKKQKFKLQSVREISPNLAKMHALKEQFRQIFDTTKSWGDSITQLLDWMYDARSFFPKSLGTMVRWFGEIVGYFDGRTKAWCCRRN